MSNVVSTLSNMYDPEVMADAVKASMTNAIRFSQLCKIDNTLVGQPGATITVPTWGYIGDAAALSENTAGESVQFSMSHVHYTIGKIFKSVDLTDEALLSGVGDPMGEVARQLGLALAGKIDTDIVTALAGIAGGMTADPGTIIGYDAVADGLAKFGELTDSTGWLFVNPAQVTQIRKDSDFLTASNLGDQLKTSGAIGRIFGLDVIKSGKIASSGTPAKYPNYIVLPGAVTIYLKTDPTIEVQRNVKSQVTTIAATQHYVVALTDATRAVKLTTLVSAT